MYPLLKVRFPPTANRDGERFWVKKISERGNYVTCELRNDLINMPYKWGDTIIIRKDRILFTIKNELEMEIYLASIGHTI
jgi:hypothetical protein